jgi:hypothetical protein
MVCGASERHFAPRIMKQEPRLVQRFQHSRRHSANACQLAFRCVAWGATSSEGRMRARDHGCGHAMGRSIT